MDRLINTEFRTATKVAADIHAGGNFFWTTFYYKLRFYENRKVELIQVLEKNNSVELSKEELLFKGEYDKPKIGHYETEINLEHIEREITLRYCGKIVDNKTLICYGYRRFKKYNETTDYESEIFQKIT